MGAMQMANKMQIRRDSAMNWVSTNPTLSQGELGYELNTGRLKVGNGVDAWVDLMYFDDGSFSGSYMDLRDLPFSDPPNVTDIMDAASEAYVDNAISQLKAGATSALDTLNELASALGNDANFSATVTTQLGLKANSADLAAVATSGEYADLLNKPTLFDGAYGSLTGKPTLFNGDYNNLSNKPVLFSGDYDDLTSKPTLFSGDYDDLTDKPTLFSGDYDDLTNKPTLFSGDYDDLTHKPTLFSGDYDDLTSKPVLFSGNYNDLTNKPTLFNGAYGSLTGRPTLSTVSTTGEYNDLLNKPTLFSGDYADLGGKPTLAAVATSGSYADLTNKPTAPVYDTISVGDGNAVNPSIVFSTDGGVDTGLFHPADGVVCVTSNGQEKLRVDGGGVRTPGFIKVGSYATSSYPSPAEAGMIVFDTTTFKFKGYNGTAWVDLS
jgi:hypothetical protein